jgi:hypothetical protein
VKLATKHMQGLIREQDSHDNAQARAKTHKL